MEANPQSLLERPSQNDVQPIVATKRRGVMNKIEREASLMFNAMKSRGDILDWEFEGITLRWQSGEDKHGNPILISYTPDFNVWYPEGLRLVEIKGGYFKGKFERAVERFRHARTYFEGKFQFQLWQKTKDGWGTPKI